MKLPKAKKIQLINKSNFTKIAKRVQKSLEEEAKYLLEKKYKNGDNISSHIHYLTH